MGKKRDHGRFKPKEKTVSDKKKYHSDDDDMINDEIDAFHKERDIVPLDINEDTDESDEDAELPVFDLEDEDDEDEEEEDKPVKLDRGMAAKIIRTQKYLQSKFGDLDEETLDDVEEEEEDKPIWGRKDDLYGGNVDHEAGSNDEEDPAAAEEEEVLRLQRERGNTLSLDDYGVEDDDTEREPTFEEILDGCKPTVNGSLDKGIKDDTDIPYETVKKDLSTLTKEEQMNIVYSSAPELVGLLSELNDALDQLENNVNPLLDTIREHESKQGVVNYLEVKQLLLLSFCQAITFYLLLKSEGHPVRDHPVVSRLVEIKSLIDKMKEMDENLPFDLEDILRKDSGDVAITKLAETKAAEASESLANGQMVSKVFSEELPVVEPNEAAELNGLRKSKKSKLQSKPQDTQVGVQSMEMMKVRAGLEEKLKQNGVYRSIATKNVRVRENSQPVNRQLETLDDFDDEAMGIDGVQNGGTNILRQLTSQPRKRKVMSGDADIPKRDDLGERRRKHELRVLAGAGINSFDGTGDDDNVSKGNISSDGEGSEEQYDSDSDDFYKQVERQHAAKLAAKSDQYSRTPEVQYLEETTADGKRNITNQIEKNRGLTRARKKLLKNPRKKYRVKHVQQEKRRRGQVRDIIKPTRPYGGEASGINTNISRSVRFKS